MIKTILSESSISISITYSSDQAHSAGGFCENSLDVAYR